jgi:hypothetical protein
MESSRDYNDLVEVLGALRPVPRPAFAAELDERAAAGFPRRSALEGSPLRRQLARLRATGPRQLLIPAAGTALAAVLVATVVVTTGERGSGTAPEGPAISTVYRASGSQAGSGAGSATPAPEAASRPEAKAPSASAGSAASGGEASTGTAPDVLEAPVPEAPVLTEGAAGPFAANAGRRDVERSAEMVLGADPGDVAEDAGKVFDAVHAANGIVLKSSIESGKGGETGARFDLLIPSARLSDALAAFSGIAEVLSRHDATVDITAPTVSLGEHLRDSRARIDSLLTQLAGAETEAESDAVEARLRSERGRAAVLRSRLAKLQRRAHLSRVSLRIESGSGAGSSSGGSWGLGDALGDAGHILAVAAGVTLIGLAILAPIALIALLAWLAQRAWLRRSRDRALS